MGLGLRLRGPAVEAEGDAGGMRGGGIRERNGEALAEDARIPKPYGALVQEQRRIGLLQADERQGQRDWTDQETSSLLLWADVSDKKT